MALAAAAASQSRAAASGEPRAGPTIAPAWAALSPAPTALAVASQSAFASAAARASDALGPGAAVDRRRERDQVGEQGHGGEVAERGEALEPERVEVVAAEQREVAGRRRATTRPVP